MNKKSIKLIIVAMVLVLVISAFAPIIAARANGLDDYLANPGRIQAGEVGAQCGTGAGSGAFQYFGKDNNMAGGANGVQTGLNNSAVCGNRQGNLP